VTWEQLIDGSTYFVQPVLSLFFCAGDDDTECSAMKTADSAEIKNATDPLLGIYFSGSIWFYVYGSLRLVGLPGEILTGQPP